MSGWSAERIGPDMWNVYLDDDTGEGLVGVVARRWPIKSEPPEWFATEYCGEERTQRKGRPTAYAAARDMWGPAAGEAVL